ncbi:hypothetical protein EYF80_028051 [Liparis tanakae]|uniref:Uncharacterized protein n=1 Tax=Liparis tanakae TaxID=230148 RepID=A0A4Z2HAD9_9TELE|nr:hypothetical protein EYF80_028051 [Liparis tanakae]
MLADPWRFGQKPTGDGTNPVTLEPNVGPPGGKVHLEGEEPDQQFRGLGQMLGWIQVMRRDQAEANRQFLEALTVPSELRPTPVTRDLSALEPTPACRDPSAVPTPDLRVPSAAPVPPGPSPSRLVTVPRPGGLQLPVPCPGGLQLPVPHPGRPQSPLLLSPVLQSPLLRPRSRGGVLICLGCWLIGNPRTPEMAQAGRQAFQMVVGQSMYPELNSGMLNHTKTHMVKPRPVLLSWRGWLAKAPKDYPTKAKTYQMSSEAEELFFGCCFLESLNASLVGGTELSFEMVGPNLFRYSNAVECCFLLVLSRKTQCE